MTVDKAAELLGVCPQTIRVGISTGQLPIGFCIGKGKRKRYIIPDEKFQAVTGVEVKR